MLKRVSLAEQAYQELLKWIISGKFSDGERITEEWLCSEFGISRTPVRDALLRLEKAGLIERLPLRGCRIRHFEAKAVTELYACREQIELLILDEGFDKLPKADLENIKSMLEDTSGTPEERLCRSLEADDALHEIINSVSGNRYLRDIHRQLVQQTLPYRNYRNLPDSTPERELTMERLALVNAILSNDKDAAKKRLSVHLRSGSDSVIQANRRKRNIIQGESKPGKPELRITNVGKGKDPF